MTVVFYDGLGISPSTERTFQVSISTIRIAQKLDFNTPSMVQGNVKVVVGRFNILPIPVGTVFCRVWKNATGTNIEVVETSTTTLNAGTLPIIETEFTFPFLGLGGLFTNNNVAVGLEYTGTFGDLVFVKSSPDTNVIPNTNRKRFRIGVWGDDPDDVVMKIEGVKTKTFTSDIILAKTKSFSSDLIVINPRIIQKTVQIRKGVRSNAQIQ